MAKVAVPLVKVPVPRAAEPSKKVTVPVTPAGTVAMKVTDWLKVDGLSEDVSETVVVALLTTCVVVPVAGVLFASPP